MNEKTDWQSADQAERQTDPNKGWHAESNTDIQKDRQTDKRTETEGHMETYSMIDWYTDKQAFTLTTRCSVSYI
jgi:hypothetical protein